MSTPGEPPVARGPGRYALLAILAIPTAAVLLWLAILLVLDGTGSGAATVITLVLLAAPVAAAIWIGVRWRIQVWLIVVASMSAVLMWIPLVAIIFGIADAVDSGDDSGGYFPGGVILAVLS